MAREIHKRTFVGVCDKCTGDGPDGAKVNTVLPPSKTKPADYWSPTPPEVDAYIDALEHELSVGYDDRQERPEHEQAGAEITEGRPATSCSLFWSFVSAAVGGFWWLAKIISKALN